MVVCKHSSSSRLQDLERQRALYDLSMQPLESKILLKPLLEQLNHLVTQTCGATTSRAATDVLNKINGH